MGGGGWMEDGELKIENCKLKNGALLHLHLTSRAASLILQSPIPNPQFQIFNFQFSIFNSPSSIL
ncbi:MAG TPA: hypothetical protein VNS63_11365, partial [Blastocatellia bacterium]|nr:hypothetical protein [Blastocatellia bacterium]